MAISPPILCLVLVFAVPVRAGTVVYTDSGHVPGHLAPDTQVVWLDGPDRLLHRFLAPLSGDQLQAARQARAALRSPEWQIHESQMVFAYRGLFHAWTLGVKKVPAVVFGDREVIYGTADVTRALALRAQGTLP